MKLYVNEFCIGLHSHCNWNCPYCIAKNNELPLDEDEILEEIYKIRHLLKSVYLSGGEPGILSDYFWDKIFEMTDDKLAICTNGTFIHKDFHLKYFNKIREIIVHCVQELNQNIHPKILDFIRNFPRHTDVANIVVHRQNSHLLYEFLKKYKDIHFSIFFTDSSFVPFHTTEEYNYPIDAESCMEIFKVLVKIGGYSNLTSNLMKALIKNDFRFLNGWSKMNRALE